MWEKLQAALSREEVAVINECSVVTHFAAPSVVAHMRTCLSPLRQGFGLLMTEPYESSHTLLKPLLQWGMFACEAQMAPHV